MAQPSIVTRASENKLLVGGGGVVVRSLALPTWSVLRVAWRWQMQMPFTAGNLVAQEHFFIGLCSGRENVWGDATVKHAVGLRAAGTGNQTGLCFPFTMLPTKKVGTAVTDGASLAATSYVSFDALASTKRHMLILELTKAAPNFSFKIFHRSANTGLDQTYAELITALEAVTPASVGYTFTGAQTLAVDESADGVLDSFQVCWNESYCPVEISEVVFRKVS
jgi:hypothetical protein